MLWILTLCQVLIHQIKRKKVDEHSIQGSTEIVMFLFSFIFFFQLHLQYMAVPKLRVELKLQLPAYTTATAMPDSGCICDLRCSLQQCRILNPLSKARDRTHILRDTMSTYSEILFRVLNPLSCNSNSLLFHLDI